MRVKEIMTIEPVCASAETPLTTLAKLMVEHHCGTIPITADGRLSGIVTDRDIACRTLPHGINPIHATAEQVMSRNVITIGEEDRAETAARMMEHSHVRRLPVVDTGGRIVGIISATDLAMKAEETADGSLYPKVAHHVPKKSSLRFVDWM